MKETVFQDIRITVDEKSVEISNSKFKYSVDLTTPLFRSRQLALADGTVVAEATKSDCDADFGMLLHERMHEWHFDKCEVEIKKDLEFEGDHVSVLLTYSDTLCNAVIQREYFIYPQLAMFGLQNRITSPVRPQGDFNIRKTLTKEYQAFYKKVLNWTDDDLEPEGDAIVSAIHPVDGFAVTECVEFAGHTDVHNQPVREHKAVDGERLLTGNILYCENENKAGFMILQEAPPSSERREPREYDFRIANNGDILSCCWGVESDEMELNVCVKSYRNAIGVYSSSYGRDRLLKQYLRTRYNYGKESFAIVCNAWGCGNFGERLCHEFVKEEIYAAAECGADVYQIDDNWQFGKLQDMTTTRKNIELRKYWNVNPDTMGCDSFVPFVEYAKDAGIDLALWLAPSVMFDYRDHEEFADMLLDFYKQYGFKFFKLDGVRFNNYQTEQNFEKLLDKARRESNKEIFFNLDVTANMRGGYFKFLNYGNLFLENRYVNRYDISCTISYHPELTLRNIWHLAKYVRLQSIQCEVPYIGDFVLKDGAETAKNYPDVYPFEYWLAVAFFCNPLLWFAPSTVKKEDRQIIARMTELHKKYREDIFAGVIMPVGDEPGAEGLSGLVSEIDGEVKFIALYRGVNAENNSFAIDGEWEIIAGNAEFGCDKIIIPEKASFAILKRK